MANGILTFRFLHMMLFVRTDRGMEVLLPAHGHDASLAIDDREAIPLSKGSRVWMVRSSSELRGRVDVDRRLRGERDDAVLNVRRLLRAHGNDRKTGETPHVNASYLRGDREDTARVVPSELNARIELGQGRLNAESYQVPPRQGDDGFDYSAYSNATWRFGTSDAPVLMTKLTNCAIWELPMTGETVYLRIASPGAEQARDFALTGGTTVTIKNDDRQDAVKGYKGTLNQLEILYKLFRPSLVGRIEIPVEDPPIWPGTTIKTPWVPMCPPLEDCEESGSEDCEPPPEG